MNGTGMTLYPQPAILTNTELKAVGPFMVKVFSGRRTEVPLSTNGIRTAAAAEHRWRSSHLKYFTGSNCYLHSPLRQVSLSSHLTEEGTSSPP